jgi:hypothetical protein
VTPRLALLFVPGWLCLAGAPAFILHRIPLPPGEELRGAAVEGGSLIAWGSRFASWELPGGRMRVLGDLRARLAGPACLTDVNGDGRVDLVALEDTPARDLVWLEAPDWRRRRIDGGIETPDVLPVRLHGRKGVLIVQKYGQLRFYEAPRTPDSPWPSRDIYSFYTPSRQAGLLAADIDGDGLTDLLCGNYWVRSPERFELPWRLFAVNTWSETPGSAAVRLAMAATTPGRPPAAAAAQGELPNARLAWFEAPPDPKQLWIERRLEGTLGIRHPRALALGDLDGDGRSDLVAGEDAGGGSRVWLFHDEGTSRLRPREIGRTSGIHTAILCDANADGRPDIVIVGRKWLAWWENADTRHLPGSSPPARGRKGP